MLKRTTFDKLFIGSQTNFESVSLKKRAVLTGQLAVFCVFICLFYVVFDAVQASSASMVIYAFLSVFSIISLLFNRSGKHSLAKMTLIGSANLAVFVSTEMEHYGTGAFMFFISCIIGGFALFGDQGRKQAIGLSLFSITLFLIAFNYDFSFIPRTDFPPAGVEVNFMVNFTISALTSIIIIAFLLNLNAQSEADLRKASEEILINRQRFELAIRGSSVGIWDWNVVDDHLFISPLLVELLSYPEEKYQNMTSDKINRVIHPDDQDKIKRILDQHLTNRLPFIDECRLKKGDDTYMWILVSGQAQWDENGRPLRMVGTIVDVDDLKMALQKMEEQNTLLEKANEELDRFVYSTSHDLKAPLSSILGLVGIAEKSEDIVEIQECLKMIEKRALTLNGFISEIIDYSRNTRLAVENEEVHLKELVDDIIEGLQFFAKSDQIQFELDIPKDLVIFTDKSRIKIILNNLITNAIKYQDFDSGKKPYVKVVAKEEYHRMIITVEDNGMGIIPEFQNKIFDMFYRASEKSEGSGLGLYIAKEMATKIDAKLWLESETGKGSAFHIKLPLS